MSSRGVYNNLFITLVICITLCTYTTDAIKVPSIEEVKNSLSTICNDIESLPEKVCENTVGLIGTRAKNFCKTAATNLCDKIPWSLQLLVSEETCEEKVDQHICRSIDKVIGFVENECEEELEKVVIGHGCDADGDKVSICDGLPTTVEGICTTVVDSMCDELPELLHPFVPICQLTFSKLICQDLVNAIESVATPKYPSGWSIYVGMP